MRTGAEHYAEAERLLADVEGGEYAHYADSGAGAVAAAQVHATLALAAATWLAADAVDGKTPASVRDEWRRAVAAPYAWTVQR